MDSDPQFQNIMLRLGYDITNNEDVQRLAANLRYAENTRRRYEKRDSNTLAWMISGLIAIIGSTLTVIGQIIFHKLFGGK